MMYRNAFIALSLSLTALQAGAQSDFPDERESMVEQVIQLAELTGGETLVTDVQPVRFVPFLGEDDVTR